VSAGRSTPSNPAMTSCPAVRRTSRKDTEGFYNARLVRIESSAPTRIDLAGGTLDIWPLYLFHDNAQTLNAAISIRAHCAIQARDDGRVRLRSDDTGAEMDADGWQGLDPSGPLPLIARLARYFQMSGVDIVTRSESPFGAGIAGSSALNV